MTSSSERSQDGSLTKAFQSAVLSFSEAMPLLMHGCCDVNPQHVDPDAARLVASLTANYIAGLADAALRVKALQSADSTVLAPPPPPPGRKRSLLPRPPPSNDAVLTNPQYQPNRKRPRRSHEEYWDEPLPEPRIKGKAPIPAAPDDWVGVAGCDFYANSRIRAAHISNAETLTAQAFLFPICHDAYAYGRVTQMQASKRSMLPVLMDAPTMELVKTEGAAKKKKLNETKQKKAKANEEEQDNVEEDDENESTNSDEEEGGPLWPGVDALLPSYRDIADDQLLAIVKTSGLLF